MVEWLGRAHLQINKDSEVYVKYKVLLGSMQMMVVPENYSEKYIPFKPCTPDLLSHNHPLYMYKQLKWPLTIVHMEKLWMVTGDISSRRHKVQDGTYSLAAIKSAAKSLS